jgi:hypothetical protein
MFPQPVVMVKAGLLVFSPSEAVPTIGVAPVAVFVLAE